MKNFRRFLLLSAVSAVLIPLNANAQTNQVDPAHVRDQFVTPKVNPDFRPQVSVKESLAVQVPKGAEKIKLELTDIKLVGAKVYTSDDLKAVYADEIGKTITLADVYAIAQKITRKYRNDGYVLTQVVVPPQTLGKKAKVELRVVEGFISDIKVEGASDEKEKNLIISYMNRVDKQKALNIHDLEHALLLVNSLAGVSAKSVLSPSANKVGAAELTVIVDHKLMEGSIGVNNYGSKYMGQAQVDASVSFNSLMHNDEKITAHVVTAPSGTNPYEMLYGSASYSQPINAYGTTVTVYADQTYTQPGDVLDAYNTKGFSRSVITKLDHPFIRTRDFNIRGSIQFDYTNSDSKDNLGGPVIRDRTRSLRAGGSFDFIDTLFRAGYTSLAVTGSKGIDVMNATDKRSTNTTRPDSNGNDFMKIEAEFERQELITNEISLLVGAKGQMANGGLLSGEEFAFGGVNYGRGYDSSEIIGDDGYAVKGELQWRDPVKTNAINSYTVYAFYDLGHTWNKYAVAPLDVQTRTSTGVGVRSDLTDTIKADAIVAVPLSNDVASRNSSAPRFFAGLTKSF